MTKKRFLSIFVALVLACSALFSLTSCSEKELVGIEITTAPTKTQYIVGERFDPSGMVVTATYDDETTEEVSYSAYTYNPTGTLKVDDTQITVSYKGFEATQKIKVSNPVVAIDIKKHATKLEYLPGETFDPTGMVVKLTYRNNTTKDVTVADSSEVSYTKTALQVGDTAVEIKVGDIAVKEKVSVKRGIFIEAETANITSSTVKILDDSSEATGGAYVGELRANDTIDFAFSADKAGKADIEFRLASLYLKEDSNWTPIWMGDCQFNLICEFYVNGVKYDIPDSVILPGGGEPGGQPNQNLWFNWVYVTFSNINLVAGDNVITLKFIPHNITDTSQSSFAGVFTANVDSLRVTTTDITIGEAGETPEPDTPTPDTTYKAELNDGFKSSKKNELKLVYGSNGVTTSGVLSEDSDAPEGAIGYFDNKGATLSYKFSLTEAGKVDFVWSVAGSKWNGSGNDGLADMGANLTVTLDGNPVDVSGIALPAGDGTNTSAWWNLLNVVLKDVALSAGEHTFAVEVTAAGGVNIGSMTVYSTAEFEGPAAPAGPAAPTTRTIASDKSDVDFFNPEAWEVYSAVEGVNSKPELQADGSLKFTLASSSNIDKVFYETVDGNKQNPIHKNTTDANFYGVDFVYSMNVKANGAFKLFLFATTKDDTITNVAQYRAVRFEYADGVISLGLNGDGKGAIQATSAKTDYSFTEDTLLEFVVQRVDAADVKITVFVNGEAVALTGTPTYGSIADGYSYVFTNNGFGQRFAVAPQGATELYISAAAVEAEPSLTYKAASAELVVKDGKALYVVHGTVEYTGYTEAEVEATLSAIYFDLQRNPYAVTGAWDGDGNDWSAVTLAGVADVAADGTFTISYDITNVNPYQYTSHFDQKADGSAADLKPADAYDKTVVVGNKCYQMVVVPGSNDGAKFWGCVGIIITELPADAKLEFAGVSAELVEEDGKAMYVINGTYSATGYTEVQVKAVLGAVAFDLQGNPYAATGSWDGDWSSIYPTASKVELGEGTYKVYYDITDLSIFCYTTHYNGADLKPGVAYDKSVVIGAKKYQMVVVPSDTSGAQFWGCVGIIVSDATAAEIKIDTAMFLELDAANSKVYVVVKGTFANTDVAAVKAYFAFDAEEGEDNSEVTTFTEEKGNIIWIIDEANGTFTVKLDVTNLDAVGAYWMHYKAGSDLTCTANEAATITLNGKVYSLKNTVFSWGNRDLFRVDPATAA